MPEPARWGERARRAATRAAPPIRGGRTTRLGGAALVAARGALVIAHNGYLLLHKRQSMVCLQTRMGRVSFPSELACWEIIDVRTQAAE
jgi:hypothetical protein